MSKKVYSLKWDFNHSGDPERDAFHVPFKDDDKVSYYFSNPKLYGSELLPKIIYFQANFSLIPRYDYPLTDLPIPVMSLKMVEVLRSLGSFQCEEIPVVMIDDTYFSEKFDKTGQVKKEVPIINTYRAVRLSELKPYFDYEKSDYKPSRSNPSIPSRIKKTVLIEPVEGFPPIFRVDVLSPELFVSASAKEALEIHKITGCVFEEVDVRS